MSRFTDPALKIPGRAQRHSLHLWASGQPGLFTVALQTETWIRGERRFFLHETRHSVDLGSIESAGELLVAMQDLLDAMADTDV